MQYRQIFVASLIYSDKYNNESQKIVRVSYLRKSVSSADLFRIFFIRRFRKWSQMKDYKRSNLLLLSHLPIEISDEPIFFDVYAIIFHMGIASPTHLLIDASMASGSTTSARLPSNS